jgi:hypothetical protein
MAFIAHFIAPFIVREAMYDQPELKPRSIDAIRSSSAIARASVRHQACPCACKAPHTFLPGPPRFRKASTDQAFFKPTIILTTSQRELFS